MYLKAALNALQVPYSKPTNTSTNTPVHDLDTFEACLLVCKLSLGANLSLFLNFPRVYGVART